MRFTAPFDWYEGETLGPGPEAPLRQDSPVASAIPLTLKTAEPYRFAPAELVVYGRQLKSALEPDQVRERVVLAVVKLSCTGFSQSADRKRVLENLPAKMRWITASRDGMWRGDWKKYQELFRPGY